MAVDFKAKQLEFTQYIRNPAKNALPADVKPERMAMYRELIFNNIEGFLAGNFPVIRKILDDSQWFELVQDFFVIHQCKTPYFSEIAEEFLAYLENERDNAADFPFLLELAHYEWVEMALSIAQEEAVLADASGAALEMCLVKMSPLAWSLAYQFPVHLISPTFLPLVAPEQPTFLITYRDQDETIKFIEINPMTYRLLEIIQESTAIGVSACLNQIAQESPQVSPDAIREGGMQIMRELVEKSILYTTSVETVAS